MENNEKESGEKINLEKEPKENKMIGQRKEKIRNWLKDPYNLALIGIMLFVFLTRLYYFFLTKNQPLWWDEAEYMSAAKSYAGIGYYTLQKIRMPGLPLFISIFFRFGLTNEPLLRFLILFIPSILVIFLVYLCINEMYPNKKIALISTLIISVLWEHLFYSNRFHTENFALIFEFLAIFVLFFCYIKKNDFYIIKQKYSLIWIFLLSALSVFFRPGNLVFVPGVILFLLIINKSKIFNKKNLWLLSIFGILLIAGFFFVYKLPRTGFLYAFHPEEKLGWNSLTVFYGFYQSVVRSIPSVFFYTFIFGIFIFIIDSFIFYNKIKNIDKEESLILKSDIFNVLIISSVLGFFIFIIRANTYEYRWFFPMLPGMLVFTSKGIISFSNYIGNFLKNNKKIEIILIIIISLMGIYTQIYRADNIIKIKLFSYQQVKDSGLWLKENSNKEDVIISASIPQHAYYSERKIEDFYVNGSNENETAFEEKIKQLKPKYLVISVFEPGFTPKWAYDWPERHNNTVVPVQTYFLDKEQKQLALITYEIKYIIGYNKS